MPLCPTCPAAPGDGASHSLVSPSVLPNHHQYPDRQLRPATPATAKAASWLPGSWACARSCSRCRRTCRRRRGAPCAAFARCRDRTPPAPPPLCTRQRQLVLELMLAVRCARCVGKTPSAPPIPCRQAAIGYIGDRLVRLIEKEKRSQEPMRAPKPRLSGIGTLEQVLPSPSTPPIYTAQSRTKVQCHRPTVPIPLQGILSGTQPPLEPTGSLASQRAATRHWLPGPTGLPAQGNPGL
jgi:hypothetical protein